MISIPPEPVSKPWVGKCNIPGAQWLEHSACKRGVVGSRPICYIIHFTKFGLFQERLFTVKMSSVSRTHTNIRIYIYIYIYIYIHKQVWYNRTFYRKTCHQHNQRITCHNMYNIFSGLIIQKLKYIKKTNKTFKHKNEVQCVSWGRVRRISKAVVITAFRPARCGWGVVIPKMHEGTCETGSQGFDVLFAQARVHWDIKPLQNRS